MAANRDKTPKERSLRKWMLMLFIGPGLFLLFYLLVAQGNQESPSQRIPPPREYKLQGQMFSVDNGAIQAGLADRNLFIRELTIGNNNHAMAEAGKTFLVIPVFSDNYKVNRENFELIDVVGARFSPLEIEEEYIARAVRNEDNVTLQNTDLYLLFKVPKDIKEFYLVLTTDEIAWLFNN
jgi:hypothetical protein